ncbi:gamma-glutamyl-gamma-aminobutyrate hydrolase family protein [Terasakiella sp. SH-1]|uniref:glutamine amidotransferase-related protein n=1 Tax=Terasakiella sp. SH-1 TaxID=2560057 RepID=UPI0010742AFF|nr:gamma-glutamyl-gamma-aminobutyrate hydrolase family protein [Terasakiella sp. SH-1]
MKIGILETGTTPPELIDQYGSYADMFVTLLGKADAAMEFEIFSVMNNVFPDHANQCDGWVITGSRNGVYENLPWMIALKGLIQAIDESKVPMVGICFGHQIIASALGGRVEKSQKGWGVGLHSYKLIPDFDLAQGCSGFTINAMHQDQVVEKPAQAKVIASSDFCEYAGLLYGDKILTFQAHPEFQSDYEKDLILARRGAVVPESSADPALEKLAQDQDGPDSAVVADWMVRFLSR